MSKRLFLLVMFIAVFISSLTTVFASKISPTKVKYTPCILSNINEYTTKIDVFGYEDTKLYITNGRKTMATAKYSKKGIKSILISKQKAGTTLEFYLRTNYGTKGKIVRKKVMPIAKEHVNRQLHTPSVPRQLNNKMEEIVIKGVRGQYVLVKSDLGTTLARKKIASNGICKVSINIPSDTEFLYFYAVCNGKRSTVVQRKLKDIKPPSNLKLRKGDFDLIINGECGTSIYLYDPITKKWNYYNTFLKSGEMIINYAGIKGYFVENEVKLQCRDKSGNKGGMISITISVVPS